MPNFWESPTESSEPASSSDLAAVLRFKESAFWMLRNLHLESEGGWLKKWTWKCLGTGIVLQKAKNCLRRPCSFFRANFSGKTHIMCVELEFRFSRSHPSIWKFPSYFCGGFSDPRPNRLGDRMTSIHEGNPKWDKGGTANVRRQKVPTYCVNTC